MYTWDRSLILPAPPITAQAQGQVLDEDPGPQ